MNSGIRRGGVTQKKYGKFAIISILHLPQQKKNKKYLHVMIQILHSTGHLTVHIALPEIFKV